MPVIALTQGMGSLAQDVAEQLAAELGLATLQHEVTDRVADKMHVSKSLIARLRAGTAGPIERLRADMDSISLFSAEAVLEAAARGNVVLRGWGATQLLYPIAHVPCIRIMRPFAKRVQWLMGQLGTDEADVAETEIRRSDDANASRMHDRFGVNWGDPVLFDMVLNTDRMSVDTCVQQIKQLLSRPEFAETPDSRAQIAGLAVVARIRSALRANEGTRDVNITLECREGRVLMRGIVVSDTERARAEQVVAGVNGVLGVDNQLRVMRMSKLFPSAKN